jgi:ankyrin repeat protein
MLLKDDHGDTPLICAACTGHIEKTPMQYHVEPILAEENNEGESALGYAVEQGGVLGFFQAPWGERNPADIPHQEWIQACKDSTEYNDGTLLIVAAAKSGCLHKVPEQAITRAIEDGFQTDEGETLLHLAAPRGILGQIPEDLLTEARLLETDSYGNTPLHVAARFGQLATVPEDFLTKANLLKRDAEGFTCLHLAAGCSVLAGDGEFEYGCALDQVPRELLTEQNLLLADNVNEDTVLETAKKAGKLKFCRHLIPSSLS